MFRVQMFRVEGFRVQRFRVQRFRKKGFALRPKIWIISKRVEGTNC